MLDLSNIFCFGAHIMNYCLTLLFFIVTLSSIGQNYTGKVVSNDGPIPYARIQIKSLNLNTLTDERGIFFLYSLNPGKYTIKITAIGYEDLELEINHPEENKSFNLLPIQEINQVVVSGTMKETSKAESTVNVEIYTPKFFQKNPTNSVYDALECVNGVRPQLNCNICNTGDIHINGLEGPYTMVLIDGMPIVSSLATVYGLSGIPNSLIERIEIVKGPSSTLFGSEAVGGIINVITKRAESAPKISADVFTTTWLENSADLFLNTPLGTKVDVLTGINYYNYKWKQDNNNDGFTDVTLQDRISVFQKWNIKRKEYRKFSIAGRYVYEDRFGGDMNWESKFRGTDSIYGESIYTTRGELIGMYQLPLKEKIFINTSATWHRQNSFYGTTSFQAEQSILFGQIHWDKTIGKHDFIIGTAFRYTHYDDNTTATEANDSMQSNLPSITSLPGIYFQDEYRINSFNKILFGIRYDYHSNHGSILTPRIGYKMMTKKDFIARINAGTGYRVVNIYTEDHAALTGSRAVVLADKIEPEKSYNVNMNFSKQFISKSNQFALIDITLFYTYFDNRIVADYDIDPNKIIYNNLADHAVSKGISLNTTLRFFKQFNAQLGATLMDVALFETGVKSNQILTENFNGNWSLSYEFVKVHLSIDYTGSVYSPMRLPLLGELDPRPEYSPWWSLQNIQLTFDGFKNIEIYGGVKNLLNWTPSKFTDLLITRSNDPFDKEVTFDTNGNAIATPNNPNALTFDPSYVFAPNQGIRGFIGMRVTL